MNAHEYMRKQFIEIFQPQPRKEVLQFIPRASLLGHEGIAQYFQDLEEYLGDPFLKIAMMFVELLENRNTSVDTMWVTMTKALGVAHHTGDMWEYLDLTEEQFDKLNNLDVLPQNPAFTYRKLGGGEEEWGEVFWLDQVARKYGLPGFMD